MSRDYERTFSVRVPPERVFRAFTDPNELEQWVTERFTADAEKGAPGVQAKSEGRAGSMNFEVTQFKDNELLCYRQWSASPETGIDVTVVFEPVEGGTRVTVTHAGFGGDSILGSDSVRTGMDENYADLVLYLEHGVSFARHRDHLPATSFGAQLFDTDAGAEVAEVTPGEFAADVGLEPGDVLVQLGAGVVFGNREVAFFLREHHVGEEVEAVWVRGDEVLRGRARLSARDAAFFARRV